MKKEKSELEQLLNRLIEKGWKPFGEDIKQIVKNRLFLGYVSETPVPLSTLECKFSWVLRELASIDSQLWQFVCENHLYIFKMGENKNFIQDHFKNEYNECCYKYLYDKSCYEYYLLESSLKDESELEEFLLNSIKID